MSLLLELQAVNKSFGPVEVLKGVNFTVTSGKVTALAGENGAGKSTLMKIISGIYSRNGGTMSYLGKEVTFKNPRQAMTAGIAIIHQELNLLTTMRVGENIFLGREPVNNFGKIDWETVRSESARWLKVLKQDIDPDTILGSLSIAQQQMVEIARALSLNAQVIIMDEPTDALTDIETEILFEVVEELRDQGKGLVFISHRLGEIFRLCDDVAILRDGVMVHQGPVTELDEDDLIRHMVGRELSSQYPYTQVESGEIRLQVNGLTSKGFSDVSFSGCAGEVVGFAGLVGAGRTELAKTLFGAQRALAGDVYIDGEKVSIHTPHQGVLAGIGYVTEDRKHEGLIQSQGLQSNMSLTGLKRFTGPTGHLKKKEERRIIGEYIRAFSIKTHSIDSIVSELSGGNQQKVSIAKSLLPEPRILILDEPTRGVDVGAKREIYTLINELKQKGLCILLMSSDMPELLGISDRILVLSRGRLTGEFSRSEVTQESIMRCAVA
ncbi:sugar ABC transporter ATP-binding protein [Desulfosediminicola flagellatus]|uniref:sugar ABC transporter ATP-binding protein n=1 Tax=Desulfosediminicola flagellatus TaxID=2569541 RepID=UPI0010AB59CE|nr:sugar ABC transporter ATP-binding protein [Desulfosediminicola flagellatus]